jgi:para-aminobenzoate synthetase
MDLRTLHSDPSPPWTKSQFLARLASFDAVVCGPGPGSPLCADDVGAFRYLWELAAEQQTAAVPVLGICLGFQSLVAHFGGKVRKLRRGLHGMVREIEHAGTDVFCGVEPFRATLYHSLCMDVGQDDVPPEQWEGKGEDDGDKWRPRKDVVPLAWVTEEENGGERVLMAARHARLPFWGVQCHPESVCTDAAVLGVLRNWFEKALEWNEMQGRITQEFELPIVHSSSIEPAADKGPSEREAADARWSKMLQNGLASVGITKPRYVARRLALPEGVDAADVAEVLGVGQKESIMLDSSSTTNGDPLARSSVIAVDVEKAVRLEYHVRDDYVTLRRPATDDADEEEETQRIPLSGDEHDPMAVYQIMSAYWKARQLDDDEDVTEPSFRGGFMGFVTYEMGLSTLSPGAVSAHRGHHRPDLAMAWISKSVVLDHKAGAAYVQALATDNDEKAWVDEIADKLQASEAWRNPGCGRGAYSSKPCFTHEELLDDVRRGGARLDIQVPDSAEYEDHVRRCQYAIREGHSYELCLTAQTTMSRPLDTKARTPWEIYRTLRARQPAPFGSYIRLSGATVLSASPERFLSTDPQGLCAMRPMKGTVRKSAAVSTLAEAEKILHVPKEEAENLMIVDLVRHDLYGVCGPQNVCVPDLLKVEEYASVFQMVTAVHGQLGPESPLNGLDVLAATLPPGSMTGAPKKRSCELLRVVEPEERSVYSGVVGYFDVRGQGDWSVTIRTMFHWDDEMVQTDTKEDEEEREIWRIGAGGAVTILSTAEGEREEMFTKLCGPLGTFRDVA